MPSFLEELQAMDQAMKKRVLIIATSIIMVIVIGVWAVYFNDIVNTGAAQSQTAGAADTGSPIVVGGGAGASSTDAANPFPPAPEATAPAPSAPSMWTQIQDSFSSFKKLFERSADYSIQPQSQ